MNIIQKLELTGTHIQENYIGLALNSFLKARFIK